MPKSRKKKRLPKRVLALPDLEQSKAAVLDSLSSKSGQRTCDRAITDFVDWYCSAHASHSIAPSFCDTESFSNRSCMHRRRSTCAWPLSGASRTRPPTRVCSVRSSRLGSDVSRELAPHDLRRTCARLCHLSGGELDQIQFLLGHVSIQTTERYLGCKQKLRDAVNDRMGIEPEPDR